MRVDEMCTSVSQDAPIVEPGSTVFCQTSLRYFARALDVGPPDCEHTVASL